MENMLREHESIAQILFFLLCFAQPIILPIPEAVTLPAGSAVFGTFTAMYLSFLGTLSGIVVMFLLARHGGTKIVSKLVNEKHLRKYQDYVRQNETVILTLLFIIPILPDEIICVGAGIGTVTFKRFIIIASISKLITSFLLAYSVSLTAAMSLSSSQVILACSVIVLIILFLSHMVKIILIKGSFFS
jgi:uncharacterized membrane protein YdjX (TVP38/TMEM64 family)